MYRYIGPLTAGMFSIDRENYRYVISEVKVRMFPTINIIPYVGRKGLAVTRP